MNLSISTVLLFLGLFSTISLAQATTPIRQKPKCTTHYFLSPLPTASNDYDDLFYKTKQGAKDILISKGYQEPYEEVSCSSPVRVGRMVRRYPDGTYRCFNPVPSYLMVMISTKYKPRGRYSDFSKPLGFKASAYHSFRPENDPKFYEITAYYLEQETSVKPGLNRTQYLRQYLEFVESLPRCENLKLIRAVGKRK